MNSESTLETNRNAWVGHVAPIALWIGFILLLQVLEPFNGCPLWLYPWSYALKSVCCAALFLYLKPWRFYPAYQRKHFFPAFLVGGGVAFVWILPETPWIGQQAPSFQAFYHQWLIMMPGSFPDYWDTAFFPALPPGHRALAYAPEFAGWWLTIMKVVGSALVIAVIEEFFFRGFFYRWLRQVSFLKISLHRFDAQAFWTVVLVFGLEHDRWFVGMLAGIAYGALAVRTGDIWSASIAHVVTNLLLGIYVIASQQYGFW